MVKLLLNNYCYTIALLQNHYCVEFFSIPAVITAVTTA